VTAGSGSGSTELHRSNVRYPGGLAAWYRWTGSGGIEAITALSEVGGTLTDHGHLVSADPDRLCRAELRVEGPLGTWTARLASVIFDEPRGVLWDTPGLLLVRYGFRLYAFAARTGELRWSRDSGTPLVALLASSRLDHVIVQSEVETLALDAAGEVVWRVPHTEVITDAELVGGRLVLGAWGGAHLALDPVTGRSADA
jgi:outer membrane protein assembly factor BamB